VNDKYRPLQRGQLETTTAERLAAIVEAAERAATQVIDDAEAEARRYLAEARAEADQILAERLASLGEQTDSLIAQAEEIRQRSERLLDALVAAKTRLELEIDAAGEAGSEISDGLRPGGRSHLSAVPVEEPVQPPPVVQASPQVAQEPPSPSPEPQLPPAPPEPAPLQQDSPAGARLLATQMAVSGNSREEIAARLRNGFQIEDADSILDAILGPKER
jgi:vacuolar-type H+-ATPase subunit H